jgi:hypothetical protein
MFCSSVTDEPLLPSFSRELPDELELELLLLLLLPLLFDELPFSACSIALYVCGPATPSTLMPAERWKLRTASLVMEPKYVVTSR